MVDLCTLFKNLLRSTIDSNDGFDDNNDAADGDGDNGGSHGALLTIFSGAHSAMSS